MMYVYYVKDGNIIGIPLEAQKDKYENISLAFKYLTEKSNIAPVSYQTNLNLNSKLVSYEIRNNDIYLEVSDEFLSVKPSNTTLLLSQVLYTYKEMGFDEVYILNKGEIIKEMSSVVLANGLTELPVNLIADTTSHNSKTIKVTYYYKNSSKFFINYIVNQDTDELKFKIEKLIEFYNNEYDMNLRLKNVIKDKNYLSIELEGNIKEVEILKELIKKNVDIKNINISVE